MVRMSLAPGFRFHPTDDELILYYLKRKITGRKFHYEAIAEVNIYKHSPWDLPDKSLLKTKDLEWFFFCPREKKYASGVRVKRATENGFWKITGKDRTISCNDKTVGTVRTLIFHLGHAPRGERTNWVIHEYKILDEQLAKAGVQDNYVLCKVFEKKGLGPKNGAQYGAPFNEADWADDNDDAQNLAIPFADDGPCPTVLMQNDEQHLPLGNGLHGSGNVSLLIHEEEGTSSSVVPNSMVAADEAADEEMTRLLGLFADEDMLLSNGNGLNQQDDLSGNGKKKHLPSEDLDLYDGLHDLDFWTGMKEDRFDFSGVQNVEESLTNFIPTDSSVYIELNDLLPPLECSNVAKGSYLSPLCQASASYSHENMQQLYSDTSFAGMNQYNTSSANHPTLPPYTSAGGDSLVALHMLDHEFYQGYNASYNLDFPIRQLESAVYTPHDMMQRGSHLENRYSRFMECFPAKLPSAAALLLSTCGGSSVHIKAEVTHVVCESTNEALSVMMGGSSSCWCNLLFQLWVVEGLLNTVEFVSNFIIACCLSETFSWYYHVTENLSYILGKLKPVIIRFSISSPVVCFILYFLFSLPLLYQRSPPFVILDL